MTTKNIPSPQTTDGRGKSRYTNPDCTEISWWATHSRPVDTPVSPKIANLISAVDKGTQPLYEDENGKTWSFNPVTKEWDIPVVDNPAKVVNENAPSNSDVPQV